MLGIHHQLNQERVDAIKGLRHAIDHQSGSSISAGLGTFKNDLIVDLQNLRGVRNAGTGDGQAVRTTSLAGKIRL